MAAAAFLCLPLRLQCSYRLGFSSPNQRPKSEIRDGIFHIRKESFEGPHALVCHILHRQHNALFPWAQRRHCMVEFVAVEKDHGSRVRGDTELMYLTCRVSLVQLTDEPAARSLQ